MNYVNFCQNGQYFNLVGAGSGIQNVGEFKMDEAQGVILFDSSFSHSQVVLEYIASPTVEEDIRIPIQVKAALMAYLRWMDIISMPASRRSNTGEKQLREKNFYNQRRLAKQRLNPFRLSEANEVIRLGKFKLS